MFRSLLSTFAALALITAAVTTAMAGPPATTKSLIRIDVRSFAFDVRDVDPTLVPSSVDPREIIAVVSEAEGGRIQGVILLTGGRWIGIDAARTTPLAVEPETDTYAFAGK